MREAINTIHLRLWRIKIKLLPWTRPDPVPRLALPPGDPLPPPPEAPIETPEQLWNDVLAPHLPPLDGMTVLVLGCGQGQLLRYLAETTPARRLIGVDAEPYWDTSSVLADLSGDSRIQLFAGELSGLGIQRRSIGAIVCVGYLERLSPEAVERALTGCYDLLVPGGSLIVRTGLCTTAWPTAAHSRFKSSYPQLLASERDLTRLLRARFNEQLPYRNWLTATSYMMLFHKAGFETLHARRLADVEAPELASRLAQALPGTTVNEFIGGLEAHLTRPFTLEDLTRTGTFEDTRPMSARFGAGQTQ